MAGRNEQAFNAALAHAKATCGNCPRCKAKGEYQKHDAFHVTVKCPVCADAKWSVPIITGARR